jgi:hypothetical protein
MPNWQEKWLKTRPNRGAGNSEWFLEFRVEGEPKYGFRVVS